MCDVISAPFFLLYPFLMASYKAMAYSSMASWNPSTNIFIWKERFCTLNILWVCCLRFHWHLGAQKIHFWTLEFVSSSVSVFFFFFLKHIPKTEMPGCNVEAWGKKAPSCMSFHHSEMEGFWHNRDSPSASHQPKEIRGKESWQKARPRTRRKKNSKRSSIAVVLHESELYGSQARQKPLLHKRHVKALLEFTEGWWWHQHAVGVSSASWNKGTGQGLRGMLNGTKYRDKLKLWVLRPWKWAKGSPSCKAVMYRAKRKGWHLGQFPEYPCMVQPDPEPNPTSLKKLKTSEVGSGAIQGQNTSISRWLGAGTAAKVGYEYWCHYNSSAFQFHFFLFDFTHSKTNFSKT